MARQFNLGRLSTVLSLNATDFRRGLTGSEKQVKDFRRSLLLLDRQFKEINRRVGAFTRSFVNFRTIFAGGAALAGFGYFVREAAEAGTVLQELSLGTTIAVRDLDELQRAFAADGVAVQQSTQAIRNFARRIGEAQQGMETYLRALRAAGIEQDDLFQQDLTTLLNRFIAGLQNIEDPAQRAALAAQFFERAGLALIPTLSRSSQEFDLMRERLRAFGVVSEDVTAPLKNLDQSITDIKQASETAFAVFTAGFSEDLTNLITGAALAIKDVRYEFTGLTFVLKTAIILATTLISILTFRGVVRLLKSIFRPLADMAKALKAARDAARAAGGAINGVFRGLLNAIIPVAELISGAAGGIVAFLGISELLSGFDQLTEAGEEFNKRFEDIVANLKTAGAEGSNAFSAITTAARQAKVDIIALQSELDKANRKSFTDSVQGIVKGAERELRDLRLSVSEQAGARAQDKLLDLFNRQVAEAQTAYDKALADFQEVQKRITDTADAEFLDAGRRVQALQNALKELLAQKPDIEANAQAIGDYVRALSEVGQTEQRAIQYATNARNALGTLFTQASQGAQSFADILNNAVQRLKAMAVEAVLLRPLLNALFGQPGQGGGLFANVFKGLAGGAGGGLLGGVGRFLGFSAAPSAVPSALAGQRTDLLRNGLQLNMNTTVNSTDGPGVRAAINQATPQIVAIARQSIVNDLQGPTPLRRLVRGF